MTDGPYAPTSMSRVWKNFARALVRPAFEEDTTPNLKEAIRYDACREKVPELASFLLENLATKEPDLFGNKQRAALEAARDRYATPMAQSALDYCEEALQGGLDEQAAIREGVVSCLKERARDASHMIEAHLMREETIAIASTAQTRCEAILPVMDWAELAAELQTGQRSEVGGNATDYDRSEIGPPMVPL